MALEDSARKILEEIGGSENIVDFTHCATRLRFTLKDATGIDKNAVDKIKGVMASIPQGDTSFQVVIGGGVAAMYQAINDLPEMKAASKPGAGKAKAVAGGAGDTRSAADIKAEVRNSAKKGKVLDAFFEYLSDSFRPILGVLLAASLVLAGLNLCISVGIIQNDPQTPTVMFFKAIGQGVFYFLPIMIAYNASKKLKIDPWVGALVMMVLMTPQFMALGHPEASASLFGGLADNVQNAKDALMTVTNDALGEKGTIILTNVFGLPMLIHDYSGNVFVPLIMAPVLALVYKGLQKIITPSLHLVFVPFLSVVIVTILTAFILGPIGVFAGQYLGIGLAWMNANAPFVFMILIPMLYPFLVPLGLHWPLNALMLMNISTIGYDFIQGPMGVWNFACFGTTFGIMLISIREKDRQMRTIAGGALAAGLLGGVSEPSLYGIHLRYKRAYPSLLAGCAIGGVTIAILSAIFPSPMGGGVTTTIFAFTSLLTIPAFTPMPVYIISIAVAFVSSCIIVNIRDYRTPEEKASTRAFAAAERLGIVGVDELLSYDLANKADEPKDLANVEIGAPIKGTTMSLKETGDKVFAMKALGEGVAVNPDKGVKTVSSPVAGVVDDVAKTNHAFTVSTDSGAIVLVHIGIDTVNLEGKHFTPAVELGDTVKAGDKLCDVEFAEIDKKGYKPYVVTTLVNSVKAKNIKPVESGKEVKKSDKILEADI